MNMYEPLSNKWALFKIPLSFHEILVGDNIDSPFLDYDQIPNILGSMIPELVINQQRFWTLLTWCIYIYIYIYMITIISGDKYVYANL